MVVQVYQKVQRGVVAALRLLLLEKVCITGSLIPQCLPGADSMSGWDCH